MAGKSRRIRRPPAPLEAGITTFDTANTYAKGRAETILGDALAAERRESLTKVFGATGPGGPNDSGLSPSTSTSRSTHRSPGCRPTTSTSISRTGTTSPHRWRRPWRHSPMWCEPGRRSTSESASGHPSSFGAGHALARDLKISFVSNQSSRTRCSGLSSPRSCRPARSWVSARSASPRSSRASSPASTNRASRALQAPAPLTLMARNSSRPVDRRAPDPSSTARASG
jgi:hypothetical protein